MYIFGTYIFIYVEILSSTTFAYDRTIHYTRTYGLVSKNEIKCGVQINENKYVAVKMPNGDGSDICYGLEHDWIPGKQYDEGFTYIEKENVLEIFDPPISVSENEYLWFFSCLFKAGTSLIIFITSPMTWERFEIDLKMSPTSSNIVHHLTFRRDLDMIIVNTYSGDSWGGQSVAPCPVKSGNLYNITLESHTNFIRTLIDGKQFFDHEHVFPPEQTSFLRLASVLNSPLLVHNITLNCHN